MPERKRLIIVHPNRMGIPCFDVYGDDEEFGYRMEGCEFVKKEGLEDYSWSEDLAHIPEINAAVMAKINELIERGWRVRFEGWDDEEIFELLFKLWRGDSHGRADAAQ